MKDKLTSADPVGWWLCDHGVGGSTVSFWWNGAGLSHGPSHEFTVPVQTYTNFRRLAEAAEPEVIEGRGQQLEKGYYWREGRNEMDVRIAEVFSSDTSTAISGCRYIRIPDPVFPPRKPVPPPKPELVKVWWTQDKQEWGIIDGDDVLFVPGGSRFKKSMCWKVGE